MKIQGRRKYVLLFSVLIVFISIATLSAIAQTGTFTFLSGDNCLQAHQSNYITQSRDISYGGYADINESLDFSITYTPRTSGIVFSGNCRLFINNASIQVIEGDLDQSKPAENNQKFTTFWKIAGTQNGTYQFEIRSNITVGYTRNHPSYRATFEYVNYASFSVKDGFAENPVLVDDNADNLNNGNNGQGSTNRLLKIIGQILGFLSILAVYFVIQLGMPERKNWIRNKMKVKAKEVKALHCNLGYLAMAAIILHLIVLSQTHQWSIYFRWFELFPTFQILRNDWSPLFIGLDLAGFSALIFLISTLSGRYFKPLAKKFSYKKAIITQQISYGALIFAVLHAIFNGSWTKEYSVLEILQIILLVEVFLSRIVFYAKKKLLTKEKRKNKISRKYNSEKLSLKRNSLEELETPLSPTGDSSTENPVADDQCSDDHTPNLE